MVEVELEGLACQQVGGHRVTGKRIDRQQVGYRHEAWQNQSFRPPTDCSTRCGRSVDVNEFRNYLFAWIRALQINNIRPGLDGGRDAFWNVVWELNKAPEKCSVPERLAMTGRVNSAPIVNKPSCTAPNNITPAAMRAIRPNEPDHLLALVALMRVFQVWRFLIDATANRIGSSDQ